MLRELEKAMDDKNYDPKDQVIAVIEADFYHEARRKAEKQFPKENHGMLYIEEEW